jgi:glycosyltransferase involved in cell wall biosynthesis
MTTPLVSVIMSVYNEEAYVRDAIESILEQTYHKLELIIIDDYSTDRSVEICSSVKDARVRVYKKVSEPRYLASSRNIGVRIAQGAYVTFQDADDTCAPHRIERQLEKALERPDRRVIGCSYLRIHDDVKYPVVMPERHDEICRGFRRLFNRTTIVSGTILGPTAIFKRFPYREKFPYMQDWDLTLRMYESGEVEFYNCQEPLYTYNIRPKCVIFNPEWLDYNIFVRNCQVRRKKGLEEFANLTDFFAYLGKHPLERWKWLGLKKMIELNLRLKHLKQSRHC